MNTSNVRRQNASTTGYKTSSLYPKRRANSPKSKTTTMESDSDSDSDIPSIQGESASASSSEDDDFDHGDRLPAFLRNENLEAETALQRKPKRRKRKAQAEAITSPRPLPDSEDEEAPYEQAPRLSASSTSTWNDTRAAPLPTKSPDGTLTRPSKRPATSDVSSSRVVHPPSTSTSSPSSENMENATLTPTLTLTKTEQRRRAARAERSAYDKMGKEQVLARTQKLKTEMAMLGRKVVGNPEAGVHGSGDQPSSLRRLLDLAADVNLTVRKLAMLSLLAVFKDVLPGYKIRLPTAEEKRARVKKEVRLLRRYERELLEGYQAYVQVLRQVLKKKKTGRMHVLAAKAVCTLLLEKPQFNFREHLLAMVVPLMDGEDAAVAEECIACVRQLLLDDPTGEITLEVITAISKLLRSKGEVSAEVIEVTFHCKLVADLKDEHRAKQARVTKKVRKRRRKKADEVGLGLQESAATEDPVLKHARQAESLRELFVLYLRVLKRKSKSAMLPVVLQGIAKFLHLLNLDLVQTLSSVLSQRVRNQELPILSSLQAVQLMLTLMQGPGRELRTEDTVYLASLLQSIVKLKAEEDRDTAVPKLIECLEVAFLRKNQQRAKHVPIFICELASLALHLAPHASLAVVAVIRELTFRYEQAVQALFEPEIDEAGEILPATMHEQLLLGERNPADGLWALAQLQFHYHPTLRKSARSALAKHRLLPAERAMKVFKDFDASQGGFNPPVQTTPPKGTARDVAESSFAKMDNDLDSSPNFDVLFKHNFMAQTAV